MDCIDVNTLLIYSTVILKKSLLEKLVKLYTSPLFCFLFFITACESTIMSIKFQLKQNSKKKSVSREDWLTLEMQAVVMINVKYNLEY